MEAVGVADNFFDLGGDSIKAVQIAARLTARGYRTGARDILRRQTIAELAAHVAIIGPSPAAASRPLPHDNWGELPMVAWFLDQDLAEPGHYHQSLLLEARQALDPERLEAALAILVTGHPGLRLNCDLTGKRLFVNPRHQGQAFNLKRLAVPRHGDLASLLAGLKTGWQLGGDPLFRAALLETQGAPQRLLLVAHHLLVDLVACRCCSTTWRSTTRPWLRGARPRRPRPVNLPRLGARPCGAISNLRLTWPTCITGNKPWTRISTCLARANHASGAWLIARPRSTPWNPTPARICRARLARNMAWSPVRWFWRPWPERCASGAARPRC
jgi:aryl carrier-like protein